MNRVKRLIEIRYVIIISYDINFCCTCKEVNFAWRVNVGYFRGGWNSFTTNALHKHDSFRSCPSAEETIEIFGGKGNGIVSTRRKRNWMLARNYMRIVYLSEQRVTRAVGFECTWFLCLVLSRLDDRSYRGLLVSAGRNELIDIYIKKIGKRYSVEHFFLLVPLKFPKSKRIIINFASRSIAIRFNKF